MACIGQVPEVVPIMSISSIVSNVTLFYGQFVLVYPYPYQTEMTTRVELTVGIISLISVHIQQACQVRQDIRCVQCNTV